MLATRSKNFSEDSKIIKNNSLKKKLVKLFAYVSDNSKKKNVEKKNVEPTGYRVSLVSASESG